MSPSPETRLYSSEEEEATCEQLTDPKTYPFALVLRLRVMQVSTPLHACILMCVHEVVADMLVIASL